MELCGELLVAGTSSNLHKNFRSRGLLSTRADKSNTEAGIIFTVCFEKVRLTFQNYHLVFDFIILFCYAIIALFITLVTSCLDRRPRLSAIISFFPNRRHPVSLLNQLILMSQEADMPRITAQISLYDVVSQPRRVQTLCSSTGLNALPRCRPTSSVV